MKINTKPRPITTHEGGKAKRINHLQQLRRTLMACMLWESEFYESGKSIAQRISEEAEHIDSETLSALAIECRTEMKLRHAPLLILLELIKRGKKIAGKTIEQVINRPDEITELVALYWMNGKKPLTAQMKIGLAAAFNKFDEYQLAKWDQPGVIRLRDVMFLVHPRPPKEREAMFKRLADGSLERPDTWESRMAGGGDKKEVFTDLLKRKKLGYMALLRNLRGMVECGVDENLIKQAILNPAPSVLPFRFISAARHAPRFERELDQAMVKTLEGHEKLSGKTVLLVDVSISMHNPISGKSDLRRLDAAYALAILVSGIADDVRVVAFSDRVKEVPPRKGMALADAIHKAVPHRGTYMGDAIKTVESWYPDYDRLIVFTDEQVADRVPNPKGRGYMLNVASAKNGVGYGPWLHIDGFSEACIDYIQRYEESAGSETR